MKRWISLKEGKEAFDRAISLEDYQRMLTAWERLTQEMQEVMSLCFFAEGEQKR